MLDCLAGTPARYTYNTQWCQIHIILYQTRIPRVTRRRLGNWYAHPLALDRVLRQETGIGVCVHVPLSQKYKRILFLQQFCFTSKFSHQFFYT